MSQNHNLFYKKLFASDRFFHVFVAIIKESLRPTSESQSLFTRNFCFWTGSFLLSLEKMASAEYKLPSDGFTERYRHSDFLYLKIDQYKVVDFHIFEGLHVKIYLLIDLLKFDYRKVSLDEKFAIHYDNGSCETCMKSDAANIIKGHNLKKKVYLQIMSIVLSDLIWKVFATIMNLTNKKNKKMNFFDPIVVTRNCNLSRWIR